MVNGYSYLPLFHRPRSEAVYHHLKSRTGLIVIALTLFSTGYIFGKLFNPPSPSSFIPRGITRLPFRLQPMPRPIDTPDTPPPPLDLILHLPPSTIPSPPDVQPKLVHYVYGLKNDNSTKATFFPYFRYLAIRSALITLRPTTTYFHYYILPTGPYFELLRPYLTLNRVPDITEVFQRPITHFAHKADIIRLQVLLGMGGTYLDVDTFVLRDFGAFGLREMDVVMGMEASHDRSRGEWEPKGLCNAIILSKRGSPFLRRWWDSYRTFSSWQWATHSVTMPWEISRRHPDEITILSNQAMFWPLWTDDHIQMVHEGNEYDFFKTGQLAYHAWESQAKHYLNSLTPTSVRTKDTSFNRMARRFVDDAELAIEKKYPRSLEEDDFADEEDEEDRAFAQFRAERREPQPGPTVAVVR